MTNRDWLFWLDCGFMIIINICGLWWWWLLFGVYCLNRKCNLRRVLCIVWVRPRTKASCRTGRRGQEGRWRWTVGRLWWALYVPCSLEEIMRSLLRYDFLLRTQTQKSCVGSLLHAVACAKIAILGAYWPIRTWSTGCGMCHQTLLNVVWLICSSAAQMFACGHPNTHYWLDWLVVQ